MASQSQSVLHHRLSEAYERLMFQGADSLEMHHTWLADILDYLDPEDTKTNKIHHQFIDDQPPHIIEHFITIKERQHGPIF